jgi:hypothetical protein
MVLFNCKPTTFQLLAVTSVSTAFLCNLIYLGMQQGIDTKTIAMVEKSLGGQRHLFQTSCLGTYEWHLLAFNLSATYSVGNIW